MTELAERRAVSTWSLHRALGNEISPDSDVGGGPCMQLPPIDGGKSLLDLLPELAARNYRQLQICHFHLASRDRAYLETVRDRMSELGIELEMLLIDAGDLMADDLDAHLAWYHGWLEDAEILGAQRARICAGRSAPEHERLVESGKHLAALAAAHPNVRVVTENWLEGTPDAASLLTVLDAAGESVGLLIDLANWSAPQKYEQLKQIADRAESCHAKCIFDVNGPNETDFRRTLGILKSVDYDGPISLIYDGPDKDEWVHLDQEWEIVRSVFD